MIKIHFIVHEEFVGPGAFEHWAVTRGHECSFSRVYLNEKLPINVDPFDLLIVLGGPQRPSTTKKECPYFDVHKEIKIIQQFIDKEKAIIGICLGAQLIGEALGANFEPSPFKEICAFPIYLTEAGKSNHKFSHFPSNVIVGHWHGDMPGLTKNAKIIAKSTGCPRQIIEYTKFIYGFQCHLEFCPEIMNLFVHNFDKELKRLTGGKYIQSSKKLRSINYKEMNELLFKFLDKLIVEHAIA